MPRSYGLAKHITGSLIDQFNSISETIDASYIMCGSSNSKGDKTKKSIGGRGIFY